MKLLKYLEILNPGHISRNQCFMASDTRFTMYSVKVHCKPRIWWFSQATKTTFSFSILLDASNLKNTVYLKKVLISTNAFSKWNIHGPLRVQRRKLWKLLKPQLLLTKQKTIHIDSIPSTSKIRSKTKNHQFCRKSECDLRNWSWIVNGNFATSTFKTAEYW